MDFRTTDIVLAACLKLNRYTLVDIEIVGNKGTFIFEGTAEVDYFVQQYDLGKCRVEPIEFNNTIKQLTTSVKRMTRVSY